MPIYRYINAKYTNTCASNYPQSARYRGNRTKQWEPNGTTRIPCYLSLLSSVDECWLRSILADRWSPTTLTAGPRVSLHGYPGVAPTDSMMMSWGTPFPRSRAWRKAMRTMNGQHGTWRILRPIQSRRSLFYFGAARAGTLQARGVTVATYSYRSTSAARLVSFYAVL